MLRLSHFCVFKNIYPASKYLTLIEPVETTNSGYPLTISIT